MKERYLKKMKRIVSMVYAESKVRPRQMWQVNFKETDNLDILAEEGYIPSDELDEEAQEILEELNEDSTYI